jgi:hypothetical protein
MVHHEVASYLVRHGLVTVGELAARLGHAPTCTAHETFESLYPTTAIVDTGPG